MWVVNREKESARNYLFPNIISNITNLNAVSKEVQELIANINCLIGEIPSGTDTRWIGCCQRTLGNLYQALGLLRQSIEIAKQLDVMEWDDDGD